MESNTTFLFDIAQIDDAIVEETIKDVYNSLNEKGYNAINQIVGYLISGDPGYISSYNDSVFLISATINSDSFNSFISITIFIIFINP